MVGALAPDLSSATFHGSAIPFGATARQEVAVTGAQLGVGRLPLALIAARGSVELAPHFAAGAAIGLIEGQLPDGGHEASYGVGRHLEGASLGFTLAAHLSYRRTDLRAEVEMGGRWLRLPLDGFQTDTCTGSSAHYRVWWPCTVYATAEQLYLAPRLVCARRLAPYLSLGAWAGVDLTTDGVGWTAGALLSIHSARYGESCAPPWCG